MNTCIRGSIEYNKYSYNFSEKNVSHFIMFSAGGGAANV